VFYLLVIIALAALWFGLTSIFKPLGKYLYGVYKDTKDVMTEEDKENIKKEEEEN
jgi:Sec-independent protein translocase protein TatA